MIGMALMIAAASAQAETVNLKYQSPLFSAGTTWQLPVHPSGPLNYLIGAYNIQVQGGPSFLAYCNDPGQYADPQYHPYTKDSLASQLAGIPALRADVEALFGHAYQDSLASATKSASFAVALWEIWRDDRSIATGAVRSVAGSDQGVIDGAQGLLDALSSGNWQPLGSTYQAYQPYQLTVYSNDTDPTHYQDFLGATPVPEPGSYALMLAGLSLAGFATRSRRSR